MLTLIVQIPAALSFLMSATFYKAQKNEIFHIQSPCKLIALIVLCALEFR